MKRNQIGLGNKPNEKNMEFLRDIYENVDLIDVSKWFDKKKGIRRVLDKNMTLEKYLDLMKNNDFYIVLQTGSPTKEDIIYSARGASGEAAKRFAWVICPYTEHNYSVVAEIFKAIYHENLEDIPLSPGLESYHNQFNLK